MVFDSKPNALFSFASVVWLVCTGISIASYYYKIDIGKIGIITWIVFIGGIIYCILKAIDNLMR
jgi:NADH:ubiquinone oxidoreductase subunit 6 (subunit J)